MVAIPAAHGSLGTGEDGGHRIINRKMRGIQTAIPNAFTRIVETVVTDREAR